MRIPGVLFLMATIGSAACTAAIGLDNYHLTSGTGGAGGAGSTSSSGGGTGGNSTASGTSGSGGSGGAMGCTSDDGCNPGKKVVGFCFTPTCNLALGTCENDVKNGVAVPVQTPGDCHSTMCVNGDETSTIDNNDVPVDNLECTTDVCVAGVPKNPLVQSGTSCGTGGVLKCDGAGACTGCTTPAQCAAGDFCKTAACNGGNCGFSFVASGTTLPAVDQTPADCMKVVCNGAGNTLSAPDNTDIQNTMTPCKNDACAGGLHVLTPVLPGTACGMGVGSTCDATGACVLLATNGSPCAGPGACASNVCADGVCCDVACSGLCKACTAAKTGAPDGQCTSIPSGSDPDSECAGASTCNGNGGCTGALANGAPCLDGSQCSSAACADGVCCNSTCLGACKACVLSKTGETNGTCFAILDFTDPDNECPGASVCDGAHCN